MQQVHDERPEFWPHGLSTAHFDGGLWLIRKQASGEPAGFVGWQERREDGRRVGYYSVGVLPSYRGHGMAKLAVNKLLAEKAARVDVVRALIDNRNEASKGLARALQTEHPIDVELVKSAGVGSALLKGLKHTAFPAAAGYGNAVFWDQALHPEAKLTDSMRFRNMDKQRTMMAILNGLIGVAGGTGMQMGGRMIGKGLKATGDEAVKNIAGGTTLASGGLASILLSPTKDLLMQTLPVMNRTGDLISDVQNRANRPPSPLTNLDPKLLMALGGAGLVGLGGLTYAGLRASRAMRDAASKGSRGKVRVTLPTRHPGDAETQVEIPIEDVRLSDTIYNALGRDTRRRLRGESTERKRKFMVEQARAKNLGVTMDDNAEVIPSA